MRSIACQSRRTYQQAGESTLQQQLMNSHQYKQDLKDIRKKAKRLLKNNQNPNTISNDQYNSETPMDSNSRFLKTKAAISQKSLVHYPVFS